MKEENNKSVYAPCDPDAEGAIKINVLDIQPEEVLLEPISMVNLL